MLEIVRGRTWQQTHTVYDDANQTILSDLSHLVQLRSQIRSKSATRNKKGVFEHALVASVAATRDGSVITQFLTREQSDALAPGEYLIDLVGFDANGLDEALLEPEPVKVTNRPTDVRDLPPQAGPALPGVPDFGDYFNDALDP